MGKNQKSSKKEEGSLLTKIISGITIEDLLLIVLIAFVAMVAAFFIKPEIYGVILKAGVPAMAYIYHMLNFTLFRYIFGLLVALLVVWLAKKVYSKVWATPLRLVSLVLGVVVAGAILFFIPAAAYNEVFAEIQNNQVQSADLTEFQELQKKIDALEPGEAIPDFLELDEGVKKSLLVKNGDNTDVFKYQEYDDDFCGENLVHYLSLSCGRGEIFKEIIMDIEDELSTPIETYCVGQGAKDICEGAGYDYPENYDEWREDNLYKIFELPTLIIGCKYSIGGAATKEDVLKLICGRIGDCAN